MNRSVTNTVPYNLQHGLANQEVLSWIQQLQSKFIAEGKEVNKETITAFAWETLKAGKVIPG